MAGGTGGHIFPALAIAEKLKSQGIEVQWIGTSDRMEAQLVPKHGYKINFIEIQGLVSKGIKAWLKAPFQVFKATLQARKIIKEFKPDLIVGTGGYVCGPTGVAAQLTQTPFILLENNGVMGLTNKLLSKFASLMLFAYPLPAAKKPEYVVGQPLRNDFTSLKAEKNLKSLATKAYAEYKDLLDFIQTEAPIAYQEISDKLTESYSEQAYELAYATLSKKQQLRFNKLTLQRRPINILTVGGSLGAQILNSNVPPAICMLEKEKVYANVVQQVGKGNFEKINSFVHDLALNQSYGNYQIFEFIDCMSERFLAADLIISRSGSMTVFEIASCNRPVIFVPLALQKDQQQLKNAEYLTKEGAAYLLLNKDFNAENLAQVILALNYHSLYTMAQKQTTLATPEATDKIMHFVNQFLQRN